MLHLVAGGDGEATASAAGSSRSRCARLRHDARDARLRPGAERACAGRRRCRRPAAEALRPAAAARGAKPGGGAARAAAVAQPRAIAAIRALRTPARGLNGFLQLAGDLLQEARRRIAVRPPVEKPHPRARQIQLLLRTGDPYVRQPPLLLHLLVVEERPAAGEDAFLHADDEHDGELESLRAMHRHEHDGVAAFLRRIVHRVDVGDKRQVRQERDKRLVVAALLEFLRDGQELIDILQAGFGLQRILALQLQPVFRHLEHLLRQLRDRQIFHHGGQVGDQIAEAGQRRCRARRQAKRIQAVPEQAVAFREQPIDRDAALARFRLHLRHRRVADAPLRLVDDPQQAGVVVRVGDEAQISENILDLLAVVELRAADDLIRNLGLDQNLLYYTRLRIGPVQNGMVAVTPTVLPIALDLPRDEVAFLMLGIGLVDGDLVAAVLIGPQVLRLAAHIVLDDLVRRFENVRRRAIILLEQNRPRFRVVLLEVEDVRNVRTSPPVDRLVAVADDADIVVLVRQHAAQHILRAVRILILVDVDVFEFGLVEVQYFRHVLEQLNRQHDQVVEVQRIVALQAALILLVDIGDNGLKIISCPRLEHLRRDQLVLRAADRRLDGLRLELLRVDVLLLHDVADDGELVARVENAEIGRIPDPLDVAAQNADAHRVERAYPDVGAGRSDQAGDAVAHLARGLVREGDREDAPWRRDALRDQVRDAVRQHAGLAAAGAGHDEQRAFGGDGRLALLRIEALDGLVYVHAAGASAEAEAAGAVRAVRGKVVHGFGGIMVVSRFKKHGLAPLRWISRRGP